MSDNRITLYAIAFIASMIAVGTLSDRAINAMAHDVAAMEVKP